MKFKRSVYNIFWLTMISQWLKHLWKGCIMRGMLYFFFSCALFKLKFLRHVTARPPEQMVVPFAISTAPFSTPDPFEVPSGRIWPRQLTFGHPSPSPSLLSPFPISIHLGGWIGALVGGGGHWVIGDCVDGWLVVAFWPLPLPLPPALVHRHSSTSEPKLEMFCVWLPAGLGRSATRRTRKQLGAAGNQEARHHRQEPSRRHSFMPFGQLLAMGLR